MSKKVQFLPDNITVTVADNENLLAAAANAGIYIPAACGGDGVCGKCKVKIEKGEVAIQTGKHVLSTEEQETGMRLACQTAVTSDLTVRILAEKGGPETQTEDHPGHLGPFPRRSARRMEGLAAGQKDLSSAVAADHRGQHPRSATPDAGPDEGTGSQPGAVL